MTVLAYRKAKHRLQRFWQRTEGRLKRKVVAAIAVLIHAYCFVAQGENIANRYFTFPVLDALFFFRGATDPPPEIVIVAMDPKSEEVLRISSLAPWPRKHHADLIRKLKGDGVKRIFLDLFFRSPGPSPDEDADFAKALSEAETIIGTHTAYSPVWSPGGKTTVISQEARPLPLFEKSAWKTILMDVWPGDGAVRRMRAKPEEESLQHVKSPVPQSLVLEGILPDDFELPTWRDFINYYGPSGTIRTISFIDALRSKEQGLPADYFKDKLVFIGKYLQAGYLRAEEKDTFLVSGSSMPMNGVEIHATIVSNLLQKNWIRVATNKEAELGVLSLLVFGLSYLVISVRLLYGFFALVTVWLVWSVLSLISFSYFYCLLPGAILVFFVLPLMYFGSVLLTARSLYLSFRSMERAMGIRKEQ